MIFQNPTTTFLVLFLLPVSAGALFAYFVRKKKPRWRQPAIWACFGFVICMLFLQTVQSMVRGS